MMGRIFVETSRERYMPIHLSMLRRCRHFWHATQDCIALYVNNILHRDFWAISIASGSMRLWDLRSSRTVLCHVMWEYPRGLQSSGGS